MKQVGRISIQAGNGPVCFDTAALWRALNAERLRRAQDQSMPIKPYFPYPWRRVARESGIAESTLCRLESGAAAPSADTLVRLLAWLGTYDIRPFISGTPPARPDPMWSGPAQRPSAAAASPQADGG